MKQKTKGTIIFIITLVILLAIFWIILPIIGVRTMVVERIGSMGYFAVAIIGSFLLSSVISKALWKLFK